MDTVSRLFSECDIDNSGILVALPEWGAKIGGASARAFVAGNVNWEDSRNSAGRVSCHVTSWSANSRNVDVVHSSKTPLKKRVVM